MWYLISNVSDVIPAGVLIDLNWYNLTVGIINYNLFIGVCKKKTNYNLVPM